MATNAPRRRRKRRRQPSLRYELLRNRYLVKDARGKVVETPGQMFTRVAQAVAAADGAYGASRCEVRALTRNFYGIMNRGVFLPNSPTLMNAGREDGMCSACFVLPVEDSIEGIFDSITLTALIQKAGGGTGFSFDRLRPTGDLVASSGGHTSGPISFMHVFAETTRAIQQGAHRRGANMGMMSIEHPDILKFIAAKRQPGAFENFNLTVKITARWMEKLQRNPNSPHVVTNPRTRMRHVIPKGIDIDSYGIQHLPLARAMNGQCFSVRDIWHQIVRHAWTGGDPGVCFIDRVNEDNPTPALGRIETLNACGEQPLLPYESCNLGSINLSKLICSDGGDVRWLELARTVRLAVRFLDNVVDLSHYPAEKLRVAALANRKIGLWHHGFRRRLSEAGHSL